MVYVLSAIDFPSMIGLKLDGVHARCPQQIGAVIVLFVNAKQRKVSEPSGTNEPDGKTSPKKCLDVEAFQTQPPHTKHS